jgi:MFS transporter, PPP family, 3-phenylpropionic acid transporter
VGLRRVQLLFALVGVAEAAILPFLPIVLHDRGLSAAEIGVALSTASLAGFVATPLWGYVADRRLGAEGTLVIAAFTAAVASVPLAFVHSFPGLIAAAAAITAARSPMSTLVDSIALHHLSGGDRADYGRVRLWTSVGWAVAACIWGLVLQTETLELLPALYAGSAVAVAIAARAVGGTRLIHERSPRGARRAMLRGLAPFLLSMLVLFAAFSATFSFVAVRIAELGGGLFVIGVAAALQAVAEVPVMRATPRLSRSQGHRALYVGGTLFMAAACIAWALLDQTLAIALVKLIAGVGFALVYVGSVVIVDDLVPLGLRGTGQGFAKAVSFGLAPILGTLVGGAIYDYAGPRALFLASAGAAVVAGAGVWAVAARPVPALEVPPAAAGHEAHL